MNPRLPRKKKKAWKKIMFEHVLSRPGPILHCYDYISKYQDWLIYERMRILISKTPHGEATTEPIKNKLSGTRLSIAELNLAIYGEMDPDIPAIDSPYLKRIHDLCKPRIPHIGTVIITGTGSNPFDLGKEMDNAFKSTGILLKYFGSNDYPYPNMIPGEGVYNYWKRIGKVKKDTTVATTGENKKPVSY